MFLCTGTQNALDRSLGVRSLVEKNLADRRLPYQRRLRRISRPSRGLSLVSLQLHAPKSLSYLIATVPSVASEPPIRAGRPLTASHAPIRPGSSEFLSPSVLIYDT